MEAAGGILITIVVLALIVFVAPRFLGGNYNTCTRCDGTGFIDEHWPDPTQPGGFHQASGKCPRCKGKGKVKI